MKKIAYFLVLISFISCALTAYGEEAEEDYTGLDKFVRGVLNAFTFPLEVPITIYKTSLERGPLVGILYGPVLGVGRAIIRCWTAAVEITTAPLPPYEPSIEPEFVLFK